ncbi:MULTISPECIES: Rv1893 family protein [Tsukamurella]|uniref:Uncharacterized protein n=1 Tax=Tsukamurella strandjordii TaxID=147577 RepID=A0AA90SRW2_9ACTN|nr:MULTISPECIES: hypothetical protein [Tsukamurella]MDP0399321.1 hypothetical protein [Tsukamurella strandjordii]GIZ95479.1 hypothetical protein TTY48_00910 [Tsukamurella sp. TY48]
MIGKRIKDNIDAAVNVATNSVAKSGEIVDGAAQALKGDVAGGVGKIAASATNIATTAASEGVKMARQNLDGVRAAADSVADEVNKPR